MLLSERVAAAAAAVFVLSFLTCLNAPHMNSRNRLDIRENPENPVPDQWYKDEGGRENCVELQVRYLGGAEGGGGSYRSGCYGFR